ncbi:hypothetical protein BT69DRAFT_1182933, partial [Atractiella rhizophila]
LEASQIAAASHRFGLAFGARCIHLWANHYEETGELPVSNRGQHVKTYTLLNDPEICGYLRSWLRTNKWSMDPTKLAQFHVNTMVPLALEKYARQTIREEIPQGVKNYLEPGDGLKKEGFKWTYYKKGLYFDGHERPDVVKYRQEVFIPQFESYIPRLCQYEVGNVMKEVVKDLAPETRRVVLVSHDESTCNAHDGKHFSWVLNGQNNLRKKGQVRGLHRSDFICSTQGWLDATGRR